MNKYNEILDASITQMQTIYEALNAASGVLSDIQSSLIAEIHRQELGNIKEPLHVLHWRTGLRALRSLHETKAELQEAKAELQEAITVYAKNR